MPRPAALGADPAAVPADEQHSARVPVINMTPFSCNSRLCYPVVGGAPVNKAFQHLTEAFLATLESLLLDDIVRLAAGWHE